MAQCIRCGESLNDISRPDQLCDDCRQSFPQAEVIPPQPVLHRPTMRTTIALIAANALVFLLMLINGVSFTAPSGLDAVRWGADFGPLTVSGQYWRMLTANFVHFGIIHIGLNMYVLWGLGQLTEFFFPPLDYVLLYLTTGIASSALSLFIHPTIVSAGASGAIFGIAGAMISALKWTNLPLVPASRNALFKGVLRFAGYNLLIGLMLYRIVDNAGHVGGLLFGLLAGYILSKHLDRSESSRDFRLLAWGGLILAAIIFAALAIYVRADVGSLLYQRAS